jgi:3-oxoacyl-[acyl-carrier-protein] synthase-3
MGSKLLKIATYLPEQTLTNQQLEAEFPGWSAEKIEKKVGISSRHIVSAGQTALDLGYQAAEQALVDYDRTNIDFLLFCTQSPEYFLPSGACILQDRLGLKTALGAFDYNLGCSGFVYGLAMAKSLIAGGVANSVLLVTAETYSRHINPSDRSNRSIFGDGAAAVVIEKSANEHLGEFALGTDGSGAQNLIVPNGGSRSPIDLNAECIEYQPGSFRTDNDLYMNGPEIFNFTIEAVPKLVAQVLDKNSSQVDDLDYVIFHQANKYMLNYLRKKSKIPKDKFYLNMFETGNTVSSTLPIALADAMAQGIVSTGDKVLLAGFGVGYSYGGVVVEL